MNALMLNDHLAIYVERDALRIEGNTCIDYRCSYGETFLVHGKIEAARPSDFRVTGKCGPLVPTVDNFVGIGRV